MQRRDLLFALTAFALATACDPGSTNDGEVDDREVVAAADGDQLAAAPRDGQRPPGPPELALLHAAVHGNILDDGQRDALEPAVTSVHEVHVDARAVHDAFREALLAAASAGEVSVSGLSGELDAIEGLATEEAEAIVAAVETLHQLTTSEQRVALLDAIAPPEGGEPAETGGPGGERPRPPGPPGPRRAFAETLALDDDQVATLADTLGPVPERPTPPDEQPLTDFADDTFTVDALAITEHRPAHQRNRAEHFVDLIAAVLPLLDEDQHAGLLTQLEEGPAGHPPEKR